MDEYRRRNREHWEELARIHPGTNFYDVEAFLDGESTLRPLECEAIGNVEGCSMLHLQCHFGLDSLSWAREGADVAGVDFSDTAIEAARDLAAEADLTGRARFLAADVYDLPERLADAHGTFDLVFTFYGVLGWLPDVEAWAEVVAAFVQPGGRFLHCGDPPSEPRADGPSSRHWRLGSAWPYLGDGPIEFDEEGTYADPDAAVEHATTYEWPHTAGEIVTALIDAGLRIEYLYEHPFACFEQFAGMREREDGFFEFPDEPFPLTFSLEARKPRSE